MVREITVDENYQTVRQLMQVRILPVPQTKIMNNMRKGINNKGKYPSPLRINVKGDGWVLNCRLSTQKFLTKK